MFVAGLLEDFDRYVDRGEVDLVRDRVAYRVAGLWLTDHELDELVRDVAAALQPRLANAATPGRTRRILATILLPASDPPE